MIKISELKKSYYAIIPAEVRYDEELPPNAKLLYGEITSLCNEKGYCWATNQYFADLYRCSVSAVKKWISALVKKGYISLELVYKEGTRQVLQRKLYINPSVNFYTTPYKNVYDPSIKNNTGPSIEMYTDNNKVINNKINIIILIYLLKHIC